MTGALDPEARYREIAEELAALGARTSRLSGMPCLKDADGRASAALHRGELVCRLGQGTSAYVEALRLPGAHLLDPLGGRSMKGWVCLPVSAVGHWDNFAEAALHAPR